jgi:hypothetical protein
MITFMLMQFKPWQAWRRTPYFPYILVGAIALLAISVWLLLLWRLLIFSANFLPYALPYMVLGAILMFLVVQLFRMR